MTRLGSGWVWELVTVLALLGSIGVAGGSLRRYREATEATKLAFERYKRTLVHDRLTGTTLDVEALSPAASKKPVHSGRPAVAWFLNLEECSGCFDTIADWLHLEQLDDHDLFLFVAGATSPPVIKRLRAFGRTTVVHTKWRSITGLLGPLLPNTKLLVDSSGVVLLVDSRYAGQECGWSFEAQVATLRGLKSARPIRAGESVAGPADEIADHRVPPVRSLPALLVAR